MNTIEKPKQILSAVVRGRRLKGTKQGRFMTLPLKICERLRIEPGDLIEFEIKKVMKQPAEEDST